MTSPAPWTPSQRSSSQPRLSWSRSDVQGLVAILDDARALLGTIVRVEGPRDSGRLAQEARDATEDATAALHALLRLLGTAGSP